MKALQNLNVHNPKFATSPFFEWSTAPAVTKGVIGENVTEELLSDRGFTVEPRKSSTHDRIINSKRVEIKTSFIRKNDNKFVIYNIDPTSDAHYWILTLVEPEMVTLIKLTRDHFGDVYFKRSAHGMMVSHTKEQLLDAGELILMYSPEV